MSQPTPVIGFTGLATAGKTTAAGALTARGWVRMSFADPIRQMLLALGLSREEMAGGKNVPVPWLGGKTPRELMQTLGTEWGRQMVAPDIWTRASMVRIEQLLRSDSAPGVVFDDVRFDNEARLIQEHGGLVVRIERAGLAPMAHASEAGVSPELVDLTVTNDVATTDAFAAHVLCALAHRAC